jgi:hypothetical protein
VIVELVSLVGSLSDKYVAVDAHQRGDFLRGMASISQSQCHETVCA